MLLRKTFCERASRATCQQILSSRGCRKQPHLIPQLLGQVARRVLAEDVVQERLKVGVDPRFDPVSQSVLRHARRDEALLGAGKGSSKGVDEAVVVSSVDVVDLSFWRAQSNGQVADRSVERPRLRARGCLRNVRVALPPAQQTRVASLRCVRGRRSRHTCSRQG